MTPGGAAQPMTPNASDGGDRKRLGAAGEALVALWYEERGWVVLDRNWRVQRGEIDLVLARGRVRAFCEVKTRSTERFGLPCEAVGFAKQRRLRGLAVAWLAAHDTGYSELRFDVASVLVGTDGLATVGVIEAAF